MTQATLSGPWSAADISAFLDRSIIPVRLSAVSDSGWPVIVSLWFLRDGDTIRCATRGNSKIAGLLERNPRVAFEVAGERPPYCGIRGQGHATMGPDADAALLTVLIDRYLGPRQTSFRSWLLDNADDEVAIAIEPTRLMSWDYRKRMSR